MRVIAGSILIGLSLVALVLNESLNSVAYFLSQVARELGAFSWGYPSTTPELTIISWFFMAVGVALLIWGLWDIRGEFPKPVRSKSTSQVRMEVVGLRDLWHDPIGKAAIIFIAVLLVGLAVMAIIMALLPH